MGDLYGSLLNMVLDICNERNLGIVTGCMEVFSKTKRKIYKE